MVGAGPRRIGKKLRRYTELQNTTLSISKVKFIVDKLRVCRNNVTPQERQYLRQHLQAFQIEQDEFLGLVERLNGNVEQAFERIEHKRHIKEAKELIRRKSRVLQENLDKNSSRIHDMALQSSVLFLSEDCADVNKLIQKPALKNPMVDEEDEEEEDEFANFEVAHQVHSSPVKEVARQLAKKSESSE